MEIINLMLESEKTLFVNMNIYDLKQKNKQTTNMQK